MTNIAEQTLASIVLDNHEVVPVLERYNLDFCCKGKTTLAQACADKNLKVESITEELQSSNLPGTLRIPFIEMNAEELINYILIHHHSYVKQSMPLISAHLEKVVTKHGNSFPYMQRVRDLFGMLMQEMNLHMEEEEKVVFPRILKMEKLFDDGKSFEVLPGYVNNLINVLQGDHDGAGNIMNEIRSLTNNYTAPQNACITFQISLTELKEFEEDLHRHVHMENNLLFPKAIQYGVS
jgi:regulator of cell morphogenesis and NO signaling